MDRRTWTGAHGEAPSGGNPSGLQLQQRFSAELRDLHRQRELLQRFLHNGNVAPPPVAHTVRQSHRRVGIGASFNRVGSWRIGVNLPEIA